MRLSAQCYHYRFQKESINAVYDTFLKIGDSYGLIEVFQLSDQGYRTQWVINST